MRTRIDPAPARPRMPLLKRLFWVYFLLLIFEGALRKWILPQLSAPLLIVRDPVALLIIWEAYRTHRWPQKWSLATGALAIGLLSLCVVQLVLLPEYPWYAALYGLRSYLLPFPVAFIMGENLDWEDLRKFGKWTLLLLLPLTLLEVVQYRAPAGSWWNKGASEGAVQLAYTAEHVRASATFSYVTGPALYITLAAAFIFYGLTNPRFVDKKWLIWAAAGCMVLAIPITGSRTLVYELLGVLLSVCIAAFFGVSQFTKLLKMVAALAIVGILVSLLPVFSNAVTSLEERFSQANLQEGGVQHSFSKRIFRPVSLAFGLGVAENRLLGMGVGYGANAVSRLLVGKVEFLAGEEEVMRVALEFGWPCGLAFMLFRLSLAMTMALRALMLAKAKQPLAWLLASLTFFLVTQGVLDQPTEQGFMVLAVAFSLAAMKVPHSVSHARLVVSRPPLVRLRYDKIL